MTIINVLSDQIHLKLLHLSLVLNSAGEVACLSSIGKSVPQLSSTVGKHFSSDNHCEVVEEIICFWCVLSMRV